MTIARAAGALTAAGIDSHADNAVVKLEPGQYVFGHVESGNTVRTENGWLTIEPIDGVDRSEVVLSESVSGGLRTHLVKLRNLTITTVLYGTSNINAQLWIDGCHLVGEGETSHSHWQGGWWSKVYCTNCYATNEVYAFPYADLARNCLADVVHADGFPGASFVVNCEVKNQVIGINPRDGLVFHSDIWQDRAGYTDENVILFGLVASENCIGQGIFTRSSSPHRNMAIVNCKFVSEGYPQQHQIRSRFMHLVAIDNTFLGTPLSLHFSDHNANVPGYLGTEAALWDRNLFQWFSFADTEEVLGGLWPPFTDFSEGTVFKSNHFINRWPDYTGGGGIPYGAVTPGVEATSGPTIPPGVGWRADWSPR